MSEEVSMSNVYRFNFDNTIVNALKSFSKTHQYDDIDTYKEAWKLWLDENKESIDRESERLVNLGYEGNVLEKLYKSGNWRVWKHRQNHFCGSRPTKAVIKRNNRKP